MKKFVLVPFPVYKSTSNNMFLNQSQDNISDSAENTENRDILPPEEDAPHEPSTSIEDKVDTGEMSSNNSDTSKNVYTSVPPKELKQRKKSKKKLKGSKPQKEVTYTKNKLHKSSSKSKELFNDGIKWVR